MPLARRRTGSRALERPATVLVQSLALLLAFAVLVGASGFAGADKELDQYGGFDAVDGDATGRFRVDRVDGVWWFVDPEGHGFFSSGVNLVNVAGDFSPSLGRSPYLDNAIEEYGSVEQWATATGGRLRSWGVNTIGAFSLPHLFRARMPYTVLLTFSQYAPLVPTVRASAQDADVHDFLGPWFPVAADAYAEEAAVGCASDPWCIGVYTDNEPAFGRSVRQSTSFLHAYMANVAGASSKVALQHFLERRYDDDVTRFNTVWGTQLRTFDDLQRIQRLSANPATQTAEQREDDHAFRDFVAKRYFEVTDRALRKVDKDVLNLGPRFDALLTPAEIYEIAGKYVDVVSINDYERSPATLAQVDAVYGAEGYLFSENPWDDLGTVERLAKRPIMITEWSYRAKVPGGPQGTNPPGFLDQPDQAGRADRYRKFMRELYARPFVIGSHWFQYMDQPATGRGDGQDSNWGLVDIEDEPWTDLVRAVAAENRALPRARLR